MTIEGLPVLEIAPDFGTAPKFTGSYAVELVNISEAPRVAGFIGDRPLHAFSFGFEFFSRADAAEFEDFFNDIFGSWGAFLVPSWHGELAPVGNVELASDELQIEPVNYAAVYDPTHANPARLGHYIFLLHEDGGLEFRKVESVAGTSPEVLTLDSPVTKQYSAGRFAVGFLYCVRSVTNENVLRFQGSQKASAQLSVTEVAFIEEADDGDESPAAPLALIADFEPDDYSGDAPLTTTFSDTSTGDPTQWIWDFGDGTETETEQNPTHEFTEPGTYTVTLSIKNADGNTSTISKTIEVLDTTPPTPPDPLVAYFSTDNTSVAIETPIAFVDESTGDPISWEWNFGDGTPFQAEQNATHTFALPGQYTVTLTVFDIGGGRSSFVVLMDAA